MSTHVAGAASPFEAELGSLEHARKPPIWLVICTAAMALLILVLAVAETSISVAWLVDTRGEVISLAGLGFILLAGLVLWKQQRLYASLPLVLPWMLYPIITQGDQIIDNLSINAMRVICLVLLVAIFAAPVAVAVMTAAASLRSRPGQASAGMSLIPGVRAIAEGRRRQGLALLSATLFVLEMPLAHLYLGTLMIWALTGTIVVALVVAALPEAVADERAHDRRQRSERFALGVLMVGVLVSGVTFVAYRNAPGAYQGSPSFFMDPAQKDKNYVLTRIPAPSGSVDTPASADLVRDALQMQAQAFARLAFGYNLLARNYTLDFHNELFLRQDPLVPRYRETGLGIIREATALGTDAQAKITTARATVPDGSPLSALLDDTQAFLASNLDRVPTLERMSASFERTKAGLQHAAHLYEGEATYVGATLSELLHKHARVITAQEMQPIVQDLVVTYQSIYEAYGRRIVGF